MKRKNKTSLVGSAILCAMLLASCSGARQETEVRLVSISSMERIGQDQPLSGSDQALISGARNEVESFQVVVGAITKNIRVVAAEISDLRGKTASVGRENITLFRAEYARVRRSSPRAELPPGLYPDPLVPFIDPETGKPIEPFSQYRVRWGTPFISSGFEMYALPFDVWKGQNQPIWIDVYIPRETPAGEYTGEFTVTFDNYPMPHGQSAENLKTKKLSLPVKLTVWDFTLPDGPTHRNHFGRVNWQIPRLFGAAGNSERNRDIELRYCRMLADHRINPPIPSSLMPEVNPDGSLRIDPLRHEALSKFIRDLHVTDFEIPGPGFSDMTTANRAKAIRYYRDYYNYVKNNGWDKRAYVYMLDEPNLKENYEEVLALGQMIHEASPDLRCLVVEQTYKQDPEWPDIDPAVDIWCPLWAFIDRESINEKIAHGDEVWSYTALSQRTPPYHPEYEKLKDFDSPYWHIDALLTSYRTPTWINWQYNITGLLYWSAVQISESRTGIMDPWLLPAFSESENQFNGGGYLLYPGVPCGIDGPISCIRLKNIRDSMEDWEYFALLEQLTDRQTVTSLVSEIAPDWWSSSSDPEKIQMIRGKIAGEIARLNNGKK
ncbi:MAG TPA: DUF4091 domain-containing protein [Bacteroidales bacterium]|nr:DUF4091 domain-containing protein [Bacteroidales bacterium]HNR40611.1 DUF4091 domain-containing protein [Bacteroidales bacterium]HPM18292.1 DUF4091 domain-containing protein [Bacteroidales bacterium]